MTDSPARANDIETFGNSPTSLRTILTWLDTPIQQNVTDELAALFSHLAELQKYNAEHQYLDVLTGIYRRTIVTTERTLPSLADLSLPAPRKLRQTIRSLQKLLRSLGEDLAHIGMQESRSAAALPAVQQIALWQSMHALSLHLQIGHLAAAPSRAGVWQSLHQTYRRVRDLSIENTRPSDTSSTLRNLYFSTVLLACAQPAAFRSREISFLANYLSYHADQLRLIEDPTDTSQAAFWIDTERDAPATPCVRRTAPSEAPVVYFDCAHLATLIKKQLAALRSGASPEQISLPNFAGSPAGRGALRRLAEFLGNPGRRRFPRRRQHYRAALCVGLNDLWNLFGRGTDALVETSSWMITNESPDGYSIMHVLGKAADVAVGDIVAVRTETGDKWQICIIRWAQSENQEHLELGLQILATNAIPAMLAPTAVGEVQQPQQHPVLILPRVPPLRTTEMLIAPSGLLAEQPRRLVLIIEQGNVEVREVRNTQLNEQNSRVEVFSIESESTPA